MKLSLSWIFDHLDASWQDLGIDDIVAKINATTAEIEQVVKLVLPIDHFFIGRILRQQEEVLHLIIPEVQKEIELVTSRKFLGTEGYILLIREKNLFREATLLDLGSAKDGYVPLLSMKEDEVRDGSWRKSCIVEDYILELDNKSITHRPDLWSHRGFAREIGALYSLSLVQEEFFLQQKPIKHAATSYRPQDHFPIAMALSSSFCDRLAAYYIPIIEAGHSDLAMVLRLARIDARPIDLLVDATNYVMYDWGQPMHAFDAAIVKGQLIARQALSGEKLTLLDGSVISLRATDCVIADESGPLSLAGIMGGKSSAITDKTRSIFIESAHFEATAIRLSAAYHKKRTESSIRFEKSLDPHQNTQALLRYLKVLTDLGVSYTGTPSVVSLGQLAGERTIILEHERITQALGSAISPERVIEILKRLGFGVVVKQTPERLYEIMVPSFRVAKDISSREDIIEEIARFYGYQKIIPTYALRTIRPFSTERVRRKNILKELAAFQLAAHEVYNYALYDEDFLRTMDISIENALALKNPLSENRMRLVTSLVPHLLKNIYTNETHKGSVRRFFELNTTWRSADGHLQETKSFAAVLTGDLKADFYTYKNQIQTLFHGLQLLVAWRKTDQAPIWFSRSQTAALYLRDVCIGYAGMLDLEYAKKIVDQPIFIIEIAADALLEYRRDEIIYEPLAKFPSVSFDISIFAPYSCTVEHIEDAVASGDPRVVSVELLDYFEKAEWVDRRSITVRCNVIDRMKTLSKAEIDELRESVYQQIRLLGAEIR